MWSFFNHRAFPEAGPLRRAMTLPSDRRTRIISTGTTVVSRKRSTIRWMWASSASRMNISNVPGRLYRSSSTAMILTRPSRSHARGVGASLLRPHSPQPGTGLRPEALLGASTVQLTRNDIHGAKHCHGIGDVPAPLSRRRNGRRPHAGPPMAGNANRPNRDLSDPIHPR